MTHRKITRRKILMGGIAGYLANSITLPTSAKQNLSLIVPAEEDRHSHTFMQWPVNREVHPDRIFLDILQNTIADIANAISDFEPVILLAAKQHHGRMRKKLSERIELWEIETEDLWCRDSGPLFAKTQAGELVISHIQFNGWGNKQTAQHDSRIAVEIADRLELPVHASGLVGEAGGVEHDGNGLIMAHKSSWMINNRNPGVSLPEIERRLLKAYGAKQMIWAPGLKNEDITDYHIDSLARFTGPGRVLINMREHPDRPDPFNTAAQETLDILKAEGLEVDVIREPSKGRVKAIDFVASYANYYACNGAIIAAQFGDAETDEAARAALKRHYREREIVMLNIDALGEIGGGIHCATQQMPAV